MIAVPETSTSPSRNIAKKGKKKEGSHSGPTKTKITKAERKAKYTLIARQREAKKRARSRESNTICFQCREKGHSVANCPQKALTSSKMSKICFKCGSTEHGLYICPKLGGSKSKAPIKVNLDTENLPFATCFVCHAIGHLARQCSQNKKGIYVSGGCCKKCGSKQHLSTHCTEEKKKDKEADYLEEVDTSEYSDLLPDGQQVWAPAKTTEREALHQQRRRVVKF